MTPKQQRWVANFSVTTNILSPQGPDWKHLGLFVHPILNQAEEGPRRQQQHAQCCPPVTRCTFPSLLHFSKALTDSLVLGVSFSSLSEEGGA